MKNWLSITMVLILAAAFGCSEPTTVKKPPVTPGDRSQAQQRISQGSGISDWPFWPSSMEIHNSTRIKQEQQLDILVIEARIEFKDQHGHRTKGIGKITVDLHDATDRRRNSEPSSRWVQDLSDLDTNRLYYDDVFGMYLLRLEVYPDILPERAELRVYFESANGRVMRADRRLDTAAVLASP